MKSEAQICTTLELNNDTTMRCCAFTLRPDGTMSISQGCYLSCDEVTDLYEWLKEHRRHGA